MGWLIFLAIVGAIYAFSAYYDNRGLIQVQRQEAKRRRDRQAYIQAARHLLEENSISQESHHDFGKEITSFSHMLSNALDNLEEKDEHSQIIQIKIPKDGDRVGKCKQCETGYLIMRGGNNSGYIKCSNYPYCRNLKPYKNLKQKYEEKIAKSFWEDLEKAYK